jgi:hypothetical protein
MLQTAELKLSLIEAEPPVKQPLCERHHMSQETNDGGAKEEEGLHGK